MGKARCVTCQEQDEQSDPNRLLQNEKGGSICQWGSYSSPETKDHGSSWIHLSLRDWSATCLSSHHFEIAKDAVMVLQRKIWMRYLWVSLKHPCSSYFGACVKSLYSIGMSRHQDADFRLDRRYKGDSFTRSLNGPDRHPTIQVILTISMAQNRFLAIETGYRFTSILSFSNVNPWLPWEPHWRATTHGQWYFSEGHGNQGRPGTGQHRWQILRTVPWFFFTQVLQEMGRKYLLNGSKWHASKDHFRIRVAVAASAMILGCNGSNGRIANDIYHIWKRSFMANNMAI
jgi:hypothetical protein